MSKKTITTLYEIENPSQKPSVKVADMKKYWKKRRPKNVPLDCFACPICPADMNPRDWYMRSPEEANKYIIMETGMQGFPTINREIIKSK